MEPISKEELEELFSRVSIHAGYSSQWFLEMNRVYGLPHAVKYITSMLWLNKAPETKDTEQFRSQVNFLDEHGHWNLRKK